jgi:chromosome segregation ATPase
MFNIKKRYFKRLLKQTIATVWSYELSRYITLYDREKTRQQVDQASDVLSRMKANPNTPKEDVEKMESTLVSLKASIDEIDEALDGSEEKGLQGLNKALEAQVEKREHIKNFIKHYC